MKAWHTGRRACHCDCRAREAGGRSARVGAAGTFVGVGEWLDRRAQLSADRVALVDGATGARLSYPALQMRAYAPAALVSQRHGIRASGRVAVMSVNRPT